MAKIDVVAVLKKANVKTDVSGKWLSMVEMETLIQSVVSQCAEIADKNPSVPGQAIQKEFNTL